MQQIFNESDLLTEYSVSDLATSIKQHIDNKYAHIKVKGEVTGFKLASSGHAYIKLKDDKAVLDAVCWRNNFLYSKEKAEDGLEVICTGKITTYPARSTYQLIVETIEISGIGTLMAMLEKRKQKLAEAGLFDVIHKKSLPPFPQIIGVITSPTGAVINDITHRLAERYPCHVKIWPVMVQGDLAAKQIIHAVKGFNKITPKNLPPDLIIIARGGGSIEDLWCFNDEELIHAVAKSKIPIISAIGHETDVTLIDYAADYRAPTPTAAAEIATPVLGQVQNSLDIYHKQLNNIVTNKINYLTQDIDNFDSKLNYITLKLTYQQNMLENYTLRLQKAITNNMAMKKTQLASVKVTKPQPIINNMQKKFQEKISQLDLVIQNYLTYQQSKLTNITRILNNLSYRKVLKRGYAVVKNDNDKVITNLTEFNKLKNYNIEFHDGVTNKLSND